MAPQHVILLGFMKTSMCSLGPNYIAISKYGPHKAIHHTRLYLNPKRTCIKLRFILPRAQESVHIRR